jgi:hypothetical protein
LAGYTRNAQRIPASALLCPEILYDLTSNRRNRSGKSETKLLSSGTAFEVRVDGGDDVDYGDKCRPRYLMAILLFYIRPIRKKYDLKKIMFCFSCENYLAAFLDPTLTDARVSVVY